MRFSDRQQTKRHPSPFPASFAVLGQLPGTQRRNKHRSQVHLDTDRDRVKAFEKGPSQGIWKNVKPKNELPWVIKCPHWTSPNHYLILGIWSMPWLLWGDVQYTQNGTVTNPCGNGLFGSGSLAHYLKKTFWSRMVRIFCSRLQRTSKRIHDWQTPSWFLLRTQYPHRWKKNVVIVKAVIFRCIWRTGYPKYPPASKHSYWKWWFIVDLPINKWWFSIVMQTFTRGYQVCSSVKCPSVAWQHLMGFKAKTCLLKFQGTQHGCVQQAKEVESLKESKRQKTGDAALKQPLKKLKTMKWDSPKIKSPTTQRI